MKKIKLFLVTLLCMVGVMNVDAQGIAITQVVNKANGDIGSTGNVWTSKAVYGDNGGHVTVDDDAVLDGSWIDRIHAMQFTEEGYLRFSLIRKNEIKITAPEGYVITGFKLTIRCTDDAKLYIGNELKGGDGTYEFPVGNASSTYFNIGFDNILGLGNGTVTCTELSVDLKEIVAEDRNLLDAYNNPVVSGAVYVLSTEYKTFGLFGSRTTDEYYYVDGTTVKAGTNWPILVKKDVNGNNFDSHLVDPRAVWEVALLDVQGSENKNITLMSMDTDKYLGYTNSKPTVTSLSKAEALQFVHSNKISHSGSSFYNLTHGNNYLSYTANNNDALTTRTNTTRNQTEEFRFHRAEYARIGVFVEQDGVLEPLHYTVKINAGDSSNDATKQVALDEFGQVAICFEHHEDGAGVPNIYLKGRIKDIVVAESEIPEGAVVKYIVNGIEVGTLDCEKIESGYNVSIIYVLPSAQPDPEHGVANFYKLKSKINNKYLAAKVTSDNSALSIEDDSNDAIFYHDGSTLLSYTNGVYVKDNNIGEIEEAGSDILLVKYTTNNNKWDVRLGARYLTCDNGGGSKPMFGVKPNGEYDLIPVTELPVFLNAANGHRYGTFYAPVDVAVPSGLEAYVVTTIETGDNTDILKLEEVTTIPANTGVILYEETESSAEYTVSLNNVTATSAATALDGVYPTRYVGQNETLYGLGVNKGVVGFYQLRPGSGILKPFRAYLDYTGNPSKSFVLSFDETDMIEAIEMSHADDAIYDLQGRKVQNPGTGIYIVNGKKIMITK